MIEALRRLALRGWTRLASGAGSRARKYRHLLDEALGPRRRRDLAARGPDAARPADPGRAEAAQRAPALLRRPRRGPRDARRAWSSASWSPATPRRPGQKEERYEQLLGGGGEVPGGGSADDTSAQPQARRIGAGDRLDRLERELAELREELAKLREALGEADRKGRCSFQSLLLDFVKAPVYSAGYARWDGQGYREIESVRRRREAVDAWTSEPPEAADRDELRQGCTVPNTALTYGTPKRTRPC